MVAELWHKFQVPLCLNRNIWRLFLPYPKLQYLPKEGDKDFHGIWWVSSATDNCCVQFLYPVHSVLSQSHVSHLSRSLVFSIHNTDKFSILQRREKRNLVPSLLCDIYSACKDHPTRGSLLCNDRNNPSHKTGLWFYPVREWRKWLPSVQVVGEKAKWENKNLPSLHLISCSAGF